MTEYPIIVFTALLILLYGLFSKRLEKTVITAPIVFTFIGILVASYPIKALEEGINAPLVKILAELTLILVLFNDASTINLAELRKQKRIPFRLLFIGLPITMFLGILIAIPLFPSMNIWVLALMALILSPTDAALGQAVVSSKDVPEEIRQSINVESGLNDGFALPPILICFAVLSTVGQADETATYWTIFTLKQFIFGPIIGGLIGWIGGLLIDKASRKGWMNTTFQRLSSISMALMAFALAESVHGNGFIAAYFAGLLLGSHDKKVRERIHEFGEAESQALVLFIFLIFGMVIVPLCYSYWTQNAWIYALLSLTVIRMLPVAISLLGLKLPWATIGFIGWFGPRGIASILYTLLLVLELGKEGYEEMISVITLTVFLSILLHGLSAVPFSKLLKKSYAR